MPILSKLICISWNLDQNPIVICFICNIPNLNAYRYNVVKSTLSKQFKNFFITKFPFESGRKIEWFLTFQCYAEDVAGYIFFINVDTFIII